MKIRRKILKCKSRFYYYTLVVFGSVSMLFFTRCNNAPTEDKTAHINDSIAKVKIQQDSIAKADSLTKAQLEQARLDSIALADSIAKAKKRTNPYRPGKPMTKYGIPMNHEPIAKYGIPINHGPIAEYGPPSNTYEN